MKELEIIINEERISAKEYIEFLSRTDLGSQYPKERFQKRIQALVNNTQVSVIAREDKKIVGVCFGLTDFAYWLFVSDLGIDRDYIKKGIGTKLVNKALEVAGGKDDIIVFASAYKDAIPFYEKLGMKKVNNSMALDKVEWTQFTVTKQDIEGN